MGENCRECRDSFIISCLEWKKCTISITNPRIETQRGIKDLVRASTQINYVPPNEASRVRYLLGSIQTNDATILSAKTTILADAIKKNDFEEAADFLMITAPDPKANASHELVDVGSAGALMGVLAAACGW